MRGDAFFLALATSQSANSTDRSRPKAEVTSTEVDTRTVINALNDSFVIGSAFDPSSP